MIYTAITNGKDLPRTDIKCFGDYNNFTNPRRNAKIYKILPHLFIKTDWSIWIDGNVKLKVEPEVLFGMLGDKDIGVFAHPERNSVYDEAEECIKLKLDNKEIINEQVDRYKAEGFSDKKLGTCYVIVRRHTEEINSLCEKWWAEICRGSVRDQISFSYVFRDKVKYFDKQNSNDNKFFKRTGHLKSRKDELYGISKV